MLVENATEVKELLVRALSWKQPFASLMLHGKIETRTWNTNYRGQVLICSSKRIYSPIEIISLSSTANMHDIRRYLQNEPTKDLLGQAIAIATLTDCRPMKPEDEESAFVKYRPDLFSHIYTDVKRIAPFPWKGQIGFSAVPAEVLDKIQFLDQTII